MKKLGGQCIHGIIHGRECLQCQYEADLAVNPRAWEWWETALFMEWCPCTKPITNSQWRYFSTHFRRSPNAPDRNEWLKKIKERDHNIRFYGLIPDFESHPKTNRSEAQATKDKCATCPHHPDNLEDLAHEIFAAGQIMPGEGIEDAVTRIVEVLREHMDNLPEPMREEPEDNICPHKIVCVFADRCTAKCDMILELQKGCSII